MSGPIEKSFFHSTTLNNSEKKIDVYNVVPQADQIKVTGRAQVILATTPEGEIVLVKRFNKQRSPDIQYHYILNKRDENEVEIAKELNHENIVKVFAILNDPQVTNAYLVMEYLSGGESMSYDKDKKKFYYGTMNTLPEEMIKSISKDILNALAYMHDLGYVHRDIKPANILLSEKGVAKLIDFGISERVQVDDEGRGMVQATQDGGIIGTPPFLPLEAHDSARYDGFKGDIWSLGVTIYIYLTGNFPLREANFNKFIEKLRKTKEFSVPKKLSMFGSFFGSMRAKPVSKSEFDVVLRMLDIHEPLNRPSAAELLEDPCFR